MVKPYYGFIILVLLTAAASTTAQNWEQESPQFPAYNSLLRKYKALKPTANRTDLSGAERDSVNAQLRELRQQASALQAAQTNSPNGSEELKLRYKYFLAALDKDITRIEGTPSTTPAAPLNTAGASIKVLKTRDFSPGDEVEFAFTVPAELAGKIWVGLMEASEPRRDLPYLQPSVDIRKYQPKARLEGRTDGVFEYTAPNKGGMWEVRMFDMESGQQITSVQFRVENRFVEELKMWQKEVGNLHSQLEARYGSSRIQAAFVSSFAQAGANDWNNYSKSWSDFFWTERISKNPSTDATFFFHRPKELIYDTLFTISTLRWKYSQADVEHYRQGMRTWREQAPRLFPLLEQLINISGERNRELKETTARQRTLSGRERDAEQQRSKERLQAIGTRYSRVEADIKRLQSQPIFTRRGSTKPAGS